MKKSRFGETEIVAILEESDAGVKVNDLCRKHEIGSATYRNGSSGTATWTPRNSKRSRSWSPSSLSTSTCTPSWHTRTTPLKMLSQESFNASRASGDGGLSSAKHELSITRGENCDARFTTWKLMHMRDPLFFRCAACRAKYRVDLPIMIRYEE